VQGGKQEESQGGEGAAWATTEGGVKGFHDGYHSKKKEGKEKRKKSKKKKAEKKKKDVEQKGKKRHRKGAEQMRPLGIKVEP